MLLTILEPTTAQLGWFTFVTVRWCLPYHTSLLFRFKYLNPDITLFKILKYREIDVIFANTKSDKFDF